MEVITIDSAVKFRAEVNGKTYFGKVIGHFAIASELKYTIQLNKGFWGDNHQIWLSQIVVDSEWVQVASWWEAEVAGLHYNGLIHCGIHELPS